MDFLQLRERVLAVFFPPRCVLCGAVLEYGRLCCEGCRYAKGDRTVLSLSHANIEALSIFGYGGDVRKAILRIKKKADFRTLKFFAGEMHDALSACWGDRGFDLLVPVPATVARIKDKGFNQAEQLAACLKECTQIPMHPHVLLRREGAQAQHGLTRTQRKVNAEKSYDIREPGKVAGKTVLLVDDVLTTGYTICTCASKMLDAGAISVHAVTVAHTGARKP